MSDEIEKYCGDLSARIRACRSHQVALMLTERICTELRRKRVNKQAFHRLQENMSELITKTFDENGKNRFLEEV